MRSPFFSVFLPLLSLAALVDWLLTRTLTRLAIFVPKTPTLIDAYTILNFVGQVGSSLAGLLAVVGLGWIIVHEWRCSTSLWLPVLLAAKLGLALVFLIVAPSAWMLITTYLLTLIVISLLIRASGTQPTPGDETGPLSIVLAVPALALSLGELFHLIPVLYRLLGWSGPPSFTLALFNLGELFAVLTPLVFWWMWGRAATRGAWLGGFLLALTYAAIYLTSPAMTGTIVIWSTGMTLYLPWPLYVLSLWLAATTVLACMQRQRVIAVSLLLLAAGGYVPQFSVQIFFSLIALWILVYAGEAVYQQAPNRQLYTTKYTPTREVINLS